MGPGSPEEPPPARDGCPESGGAECLHSGLLEASPIDMNESFIHLWLMVKARTADRLERIVDAALFTFIDQGYRGTTIQHVAHHAGVSVGSVYSYAAGKEALFELSLRRALHEPLPDPGSLPYEAATGDLVSWVWSCVVDIAQFPHLEAAAERPAPPDPLDELEDLVGGIWDWQARYWRAIELIERCAREWPDLHMLYYKEFRRGAFETATRLLKRRMAEGALRAYPDPGTALRVVVESVAFFAMHRHIRPDSADLDEETCRTTVLQMTRAAFDPGCE